MPLLLGISWKKVLLWKVQRFLEPCDSRLDFLAATHRSLSVARVYFSKKPERLKQGARFGNWHQTSVVWWDLTRSWGRQRVLYYLICVQNSTHGLRVSLSRRQRVRGVGWTLESQHIMSGVEARGPLLRCNQQLTPATGHVITGLWK